MAYLVAFLDVCIQHFLSCVQLPALSAWQAVTQMGLLYVPCNVRPAHFFATPLPGATGTLAILVNIAMFTKVRANIPGSRFKR